MALFEDENFEESAAETENAYLSNPDKGMELIRAIFARDHDSSDGMDELSDLIDWRLKSLLTDMNPGTQRFAVHTLDRVKSQAAQMRKVRLLAGKTVLGIGGRFSAGKSCFINSLTNAGLPEGQRATTSIATYIVKANQKSSAALTVYNRSVPLDDMAVDALTHEFSRKYNIGFSRVIESLAIYSPDFTYPNIAILDTPGYSKADTGKNEDAADVEIARSQLSSADYLIWLMDVEGGVISESDLRFLRTLNVETEILFIFNKAGLKNERQVEQVVTQTREMLEQFEKKTYAVMAYDSREKRTVLGDGTLERFLSEIDRRSGANGGHMDLAGQIRDVQQRIAGELAETRLQTETRLPAFRQSLSNAHKPEYIRSVIREYGERRETIRRIEREQTALASACLALSRHLKRIERDS